MSGLFGKAARFARTKQGKQAIEKLQNYAKSDEGKQRIEGLKGKVEDIRGGKGGDENEAAAKGAPKPAAEAPKAAPAPKAAAEDPKPDPGQPDTPAA